MLQKSVYIGDFIKFSLELSDSPFCYKKHLTANFLGHPFTQLLLLKSPILLMLLISFSFNLTLILLYKYLCLGFNKSVFNLTFCQLLRLRKTQLHETILVVPFTIETSKLFSPFPSSTQMSFLLVDEWRKTFFRWRSISTFFLSIHCQVLFLALYEKYRQVSPSIAKYCQISPDIAKYRQVLPSTTKYGQVWPSMAKYGQVWPSIAKYCQVSPSIAKDHQVLPSITKYCQSLVIHFDDLNLICDSPILYSLGFILPM